MVNIFQKKESELDEPIEEVLSHMRGHDPDSDEYKSLFGQLERMINLRREERGSDITPNQVLAVAGNLLGILIIVAYEQKHVMVSKALGFVLRSKQTD